MDGLQFADPPFRDRTILMWTLFPGELIRTSLPVIAIVGRLIACVCDIQSRGIAKWSPAAPVHRMTLGRLEHVNPAFSLVEFGAPPRRLCGVARRGQGVARIMGDAIRG